MYSPCLSSDLWHWISHRLLGTGLILYLVFLLWRISVRLKPENSPVARRRRAAKALVVSKRQVAVPRIFLKAAMVL